MFVVSFIYSGNCSSERVLSLEEQGQDCKTSLLNQRTTLTLDTNGVFSNQPGFNRNNALYRIRLVDYVSDDEAFLRNLRSALQDLRGKTTQLGQVDYMQTMERLVSVDADVNGVKVQWNIDAGHILRAQQETVEFIYFFEDENARVTTDHAACSANYTRVVYSTADVLPSTAENYATFRVKFVTAAEELTNGDEYATYLVSANSNFCDAAGEGSQTLDPETAESFLDVLEVERLAQDRKKYVLAFDVRIVSPRFPMCVCS